MLASAPRPGCAADGGETRAACSKAQIAAAVSANWDQVHSLMVDFTSWHADRVGSAQRSNVVLVADGCRRYARTWHGIDPDFTHDPGATEQIFDGQTWNRYLPYARLYEVSREFARPPYTDKIMGQMFFEATAWRPATDNSRGFHYADGTCFLLSDVWRDGSYTVAPLRERVDGVLCHVIERPGRDRLWIDTERGVLRRRQRLGGEPPRLEIAFDLRDYRKVGPGVWLPFEIRRDHYVADYHTVHRVREYRINVPMDEFFDFVPPPGAYVHNRDDDTFQQVPGGLDFLEGLVKRAKTVVSGGSAASQLVSHQLTTLCLSFIGGIGATFLSSRVRMWHASHKEFRQGHWEREILRPST